MVNDRVNKGDKLSPPVSNVNSNMKFPIGGGMLRVSSHELKTSQVNLGALTNVLHSGISAKEDRR